MTIRFAAILMALNCFVAPAATPVRGAISLAPWFEENRGQERADVLFVAPGARYRLLIRKNDAELKIAGGGGIHITPIGADLTSLPAPRDPLAGRSNYLIGRDPGAWKTGVRQYGGVERKGVWPGIDQVYHASEGHGSDGGLEYDFILQPGADPSTIALELAGGDSYRIDEAGDLVLTSGSSVIRQRRPLAYQVTPAGRREIAVTYSLSGDVLHFQIAPYDRSLQLVIDPVLTYSTFVSGSGDNEGYAIAVDSAGSAYLTGSTSSSDFPVQGAEQPGIAGNYDVFVAKLNASGSGLVYATFVGGSDDEYGLAIGVSANGEAVVAGSTQSVDFPVAAAYSSAARGGADAFVFRLNAAGSGFIFSTYLGGAGDDVANGVAVNGQIACAAGVTESSNFPTLNAWRGAYGGGGDAFLTCFNGASLLSSTYIGGSGSDTGMGVALDSNNQAYVTGYTTSGDFPTVSAMDSTLSGPDDGFVVRLPAAGGPPGYSTLLGGNSYEEAHAIAVDQTGAAYITGFTYSNNFPTTTGAFRTTYDNYTDGFVTKLNPTGSAIVYSTYLAGRGEDSPWAIAVDKIGNAYIAGSTTSPDFPTVNAVQANIAGGGERILKTTNGITWTDITGPAMAVEDADGIAVDPANSNHILAIILYDQLYQSFDGGSNWAAVPTGFAAQTSCANAVAISPANANYIYLATCSDGIYGSQDGGRTWAAMSGTGVNQIYWFASDSTGAVYAAGSNGGLYKIHTTDTSWTTIPTNLSTNIDVVLVDPTNALNIYLGTDSGIYHSINGGAFNPPSSAPSEQVTGLVFQPGSTTTLFASFWCSGVYESINSGASWFWAGQSGCFNSLQFSGNTLYAGNLNEGIDATTNFGLSWLGNVLPVQNWALAAGGGTLYGAFLPGQDGFVTKLNATGSALVYSTYFGSSATYETAWGIAVDAAGASAYVGGTTSPGPPPYLPTTAGAFQTTISGYNAAYAAKFTDTSCVYAVSGSSINVGISGGLGSISVTVASGCQWIATSAPAWVTLTGGNPGSGAGTVSYTVQPNITTTARSATFWIAGQAISVTQAAGSTCSYAFASAGANAPAAGASGSVTMNSSAGCSWTAVSNASWITLSGSTGANGAGVLNYTAAPNTTLVQQTGTITAAGQTFTVTQAAAVCNYTLSSPSTPLSSDGGSTTVTVTASPSTCTWTASVATGGAWLSISENPSVVDPRKVVFGALPNSGAPRSGTLLVAGQTFTVNQGGTGAPVYFTWTRQATGTISDNDAQLIDINNDGYPEMVFTQLIEPEGTLSPVLVYKNNGNMTFTDQTATLLPAGTTVTHPRRLEVADFNKDGRPDLFISDHGMDAVPFPGAQSKLLNGSTSNVLVDVTATNLPQESRYSHYVTVGDFNKDGWTDYVQAQGNCGPATYVNDGTGKFIRDISRLPANLTNCQVSTYAVQLVDVNNNGCPDLFVGGDPTQPGQTSDILLMNDCTGHFTPAPAGAVPARIPDATYGTVAYTTADFNNDGWPDVLAIRMTNTNWTLQLMLNNGDGTFRDASTRLPADWIPYASGANWLKFVQPIDINNDGYMDILVRGNWGSSTLLLNTGQGQFVDVKDLLPTGILTPNDTATWFDLGPSIQAGDLNKDGKPDILAALRFTELAIGQNVNLLPSVSGCGYGVSATAPSAVAAGATIPVTVSANAGCRWIATSDVSWITFTTQGVNTGAGGVSIVVAPSYSGQARVGTAVVAGKTIMVTQAANACVNQLPYSSISVDASGGSGTLPVMSTPADCAVGALSNAAAWLSASVSGSTVTFTALPNIAFTPRSGTVSIGSQTFTVNQAASLGLTSTTTVGTIAPEPSLVNQAYAVAFTVTAASGTPSGSVTVSDGAASNTCAVAALTCSLSSTAAGTKTITATYSGDATFAASSASKMHTVNLAPSLSISKSHTAAFARGWYGPGYTVIVSNAAGAGPTSGVVTVTEMPPAGMTVVSMSGGSSWNCAAAPVCTTSAVLNGGSSYPAITVTVSVGTSATAVLTNQVSVSGAGSANANGSDPTSIAMFNKCDLQQSGSVNVADVQLLINQALGVTAAANFLAGGSSVSVIDVQIEINAALGLGCASK